MILLTGATGTIGRHVVTLLSAAGAQFRILARNPSKASEIAGPNIEVLQGDLADRSAIERSLAGVDHLFLLTPSGNNQMAVEKGIVDAAAQAGVEHIVRISVLGASPFSSIKINQWHWFCEKYIEQVGIPMTALRPTFFMQNTLMFAPVIASEGKFYAPGGDGRVSMIDARDIAAVAVASLTQAGHMDRVYDLTGPQAVSFHEIAANIGSAIGKTAEYVNVPPEVARHAMISAGTPEWLTDDLLTYYQYFRAGNAEQVTPIVERVKGTSAISYAQFAQDYSNAFANGKGQ